MSQGEKVPCEAFHIHHVAGNVTVSYERTVYTTTEGQGMVELYVLLSLEELHEHSPYPSPHKMAQQVVHGAYTEVDDILSIPFHSCSC